MQAQEGTTVADWLTVRFAASESLRVVDRTAESETVRELEIGLASEGAAETSERMGVDGVVTGALLVHDGKLLIFAKLSSLADESVQGLWVEESVDKGLAAATDALTAKLEPIVHAWARDMRARRGEAEAARKRRPDDLKEVGGSSWTVVLEEHFDRDYRLFTGVAEAAVIEVLRQAGGSVRASGEDESPVAPGTWRLRGTAHCTVPVQRDGRSVARAVCSLRLEGDGGVIFDDATAVRSFAALQARDAGYAALQAAGEAAALALLERYAKIVRRHTVIGDAQLGPHRNPAPQLTRPTTVVDQPSLQADPNALKGRESTSSPFERLAALQEMKLPVERLAKEVEATMRRLPDPRRDVPGALCLELAQGYADRGRWAEGYQWLVRMRDSRIRVEAGTAVSQWALRAAQASEVGSNIVQRYVAILVSLDHRASIDGLPLMQIAERLRAEGRPREAAEIARQVSWLGLIPTRKENSWSSHLNEIESLVLGFEVACRFEAGDPQGAVEAFLPFRLRGGLKKKIEPSPSDATLRPFSPEFYQPDALFGGMAWVSIHARIVSPALSVLPTTDEAFAAAYRDAYARRELPPEWHFEIVLEQMERGNRSTSVQTGRAMERLQELYQPWSQWVSTSDVQRARMAERLAKLPPFPFHVKGFGRAWPLPDEFVPQSLPLDWATDPDLSRPATNALAASACPPGLAVDIVNTGDALLLASQELAAFRIAALQTNLHPLIRSVGNETGAFAGPAETHAADLLRTAASSLLLSRRGDVLWGQCVDIRGGELLAVTSETLSNGVGRAVESLVDRLLPTAMPGSEKEAPARWLGVAPIGACPAVEVQAALLQHAGVRILPRDIGWLLRRERGLGLGDVPLLKADVELWGETATTRQRGVDGESMWLVADPCDGTARREETLFIPAGTPTNECARRAADRFVTMSRDAPARPSQSSTVQPRGVLTGNHPTLGILTHARLETEAQRAEDWYRLYPGNYDNDEIQALSVSRPNWWRSDPSAVGRIVRTLTARMRWERTYGRPSSQRMADRSAVADAWLNWREVSLHAAARLTDSYFQAYYERDDPNDIACPDVVLIFALFNRTTDNGEKTPLFRRQQFFACLRASVSPIGRLLGADEAMLEALFDPKRVTPDAFADASIRLLSTTNGLSRFLMLELRPKAKGFVTEESLLAWGNETFDPAISMMLRTLDPEYGPYATRLRQAWTGYLREAPRPLPEPLRVQLRRHLDRDGIRRMLEASLREEDGVLPPPPSVTTSTPPDPAPVARTPTVDWPADWFPPPAAARFPGTGTPAASWSAGRRLYGAGLEQSAFQVHWCDLDTGAWGEGAAHAATLAQADNAVFDMWTQMITFGQQHYIHRRHDRLLWELRNDGTLLSTPLFPTLNSLSEGDWVVGYGDGFLVAKNIGGRILHWDRSQDTLTELANAHSTRSGGLNNHPFHWKLSLLAPSTEADTFDIVVSGQKR